MLTEEIEIDHSLSQLQFAEQQHKVPCPQTPPMNCEHDLKAMLADVDRCTTANTQSPFRSHTEDLDELRTCLEQIQGVAKDCETTGDGLNGAHCSIAGNESAFQAYLIPYVIALQLETSTIEWKKAREWTKLLFGNDKDSYMAQTPQSQAVTQAVEILEGIDQRHVEESKDSVDIHEKNRPSCRLRIDNIAADADEADIELCFDEFRPDM